MDDRQKVFLGDLARAEELAGADLVRAQRRVGWLAETADEELAEFLAAVAELPLPLEERTDELLAAALAAVARRRRQGEAQPIGEVVVEPLVSLYEQLGPSSRARAQLLTLLAQSDADAQLDALATLLVDDPPAEDADIVQALAPLFRRAAPLRLFPRVLAALAHPSLAAPILDLANFVARQRLVAEHPAADRSRQLITLLGGIIQGLARLEELPPDSSSSAIELSNQVASQVALAVSLCDALAQIGDVQAVGKLHQAMMLRHRRLRTEAAAALARLGDEDGQRELIALAEEPVARLRVLAYASELGITDRIEPQWRTPEAQAEAQLAVHLAEPTQFGIPPMRLELFDHRQMYWPGFTAPVDCFLIRYTYAVTIEGEGQRSLSNIGIAGPLAHAFLADLADLAPDDIYAAYAGWQAEHEEIREFPVSQLSKSEKLEAERLSRRLHDAGFGDIQPQHMGYFFGDKALVAEATREGVSGVAVADFAEIAFFPRRHSRRPLGPRDAYNIYKGRKLLHSFNRAGGEATRGGPAE